MGMTPSGKLCRMDLTGHVRELLAATSYLVLGTTDADGNPWTAPVCFAPDGTRDYLWASRTDAEHSRHLAARPRVSVVVFDSGVPLYHGRAVYATGDAAVVPDGDLDRALAAYPGDRIGATTPDPADVSGDSPYRLYRFRATDLWVLCPREPRQACSRHGIDHDHRVRVD